MAGRRPNCSSAPLRVAAHQRATITGRTQTLAASPTVPLCSTLPSCTATVHHHPPYTLSLIAPSTLFASLACSARPCHDSLTFPSRCARTTEKSIVQPDREPPSSSIVLSDLVFISIFLDLPDFLYPPFKCTLFDRLSLLLLYYCPNFNC